MHHAVHKVRGQADVAVRNRIARAGRYHPAVLVEVRQEIPQLRLALDALLVGAGHVEHYSIDARRDEVALGGEALSALLDGSAESRQG